MFSTLVMFDKIINLLVTIALMVLVKSIGLAYNYCTYYYNFLLYFQNNINTPTYKDKECFIYLIFTESGQCLFLFSITPIKFGRLNMLTIF